MESHQPQYEFDKSQNELILDLSQKMRLVAYFLMGLGVFAVIFGLLGINAGSIIQGIVQFIIGLWTMKAASFFKQIVDTRENDIVNLMGALAELRKLYTFQYWLLIIALIFMAIALVVALIFGIGASIN